MVARAFVARGVEVIGRRLVPRLVARGRQVTVGSAQVPASVWFLASVSTAPWGGKRVGWRGWQGLASRI
jgi:hypothetical protein